MLLNRPYRQKEKNGKHCKEHKKQNDKAGGLFMKTRQFISAMLVFALCCGIFPYRKAEASACSGNTVEELMAWYHNPERSGTVFTLTGDMICQQRLSLLEEDRADQSLLTIAAGEDSIVF